MCLQVHSYSSTLKYTVLTYFSCIVTVKFCCIKIRLEIFSTVMVTWFSEITVSSILGVEDLFYQFLTIGKGLASKGLSAVVIVYQK